MPRFPIKGIDPRMRVGIRIEQVPDRNPSAESRLYTAIMFRGIPYLCNALEPR